MHDQEMVHGDLKGVSISVNLDHHPTPNLHSGQYPRRSEWPRTHSRLRTTRRYLGSLEPHRLKFVGSRRYDTMDESRTLLPRQIRSQGRPTDEAIRLLRVWDGYLRGVQWACTLHAVSLLRRHPEGYPGRAPIKTKRTRGSGLHGRPMADARSVLGGSATTPAQRYGCPRMFGAGFEGSEDTLPGVGREHRGR